VDAILGAATRPPTLPPDPAADPAPPPATADLFTRAGAIVAERAARGGATRDDIERIIMRAAAQAARALAAA
jgi:hypothetical protein